MTQRDVRRPPFVGGSNRALAWLYGDAYADSTTFFLWVRHVGDTFLDLEFLILSDEGSETVGMVDVGLKYTSDWHWISLYVRCTLSPLAQGTRKRQRTHLYSLHVYDLQRLGRMKDRT